MALYRQFFLQKSIEIFINYLSYNLIQKIIQLNYFNFRHFLLVEWNMLTLYNYQGRTIGTPKWKGMTQELLYPICISLCPDTLVVRNQSNEKCR